VCVTQLTAHAADVPADDEWLLPAERDIMARFVIPKRRAEWRLGRWAAKALVERVLGTPAASVHVRAALDGAPQAWCDGAPLPISLSLSHRAGTAFCVVAAPAMPLGCDVELVEPRAAAFAAEWFTDSERALLDTDRDLLTTVLWSAKESMLKMLRCGLRRDPRSLEVHTCERQGTVDGWHRLQVHDTETGVDAQGWWRVEGALVLSLVASALPVPPAASAR
jgi:4'-phosphopantetheinyl transferase